MIPTITVEDHDGEKEVVAKDAPQSPQEDAQEVPASPETDSIPGAIPAAPAYTIPDWYVIGWRQHAGVDKPALEGEDKDKSVLDQFLTEQFYGAWYHNAAVIVLVRVFSFTLRSADHSMRSSRPSLLLIS